MKILVIGNYLEKTGYSNHTLAYINALDGVGADVVCRHINMTGGNNKAEGRIKELESKNLNNVDAILQYNLPTEFSRTANCLNIGGFSYETDSVIHSGWVEKIRMMDKIIVPAIFQMAALPPDVMAKSSLVKMPFDHTKYEKPYETIDFGLPQDCYKFYTISEFNKRKNVHAMLIAYLSEFSRTDNTCLVLKVNIPGKNPQETKQIVSNTINEIKVGLKRFNHAAAYPQVIVVSDFINDSQVMSLHKTCDCFVSSSYGESVCIPYVESQFFGNQTIVPESFNDYLISNTNFVNVRRERCFGNVDSLPNLYSSDEKWKLVSTLDLAQKMRSVYNNNKANQKVPYNQDSYEDMISYKKIGNQIMDLISAN